VIRNMDIVDPRRLDGEGAVFPSRGGQPYLISEVQARVYNRNKKKESFQLHLWR
jgi:hypothetical protein